jgi:hypothetical protein
MKARLNRLIDIIRELQNITHDDELNDELDNAATYLESALDRWVALEEEHESETDMD